VGHAPSSEGLHASLSPRTPWDPELHAPEYRAHSLLRPEGLIWRKSQKNLSSLGVTPPSCRPSQGGGAKGKAPSRQERPGARDPSATSEQGPRGQLITSPSSRRA